MAKRIFLLIILLIFTGTAIFAYGYHRGYGNSPYYGDSRYEIKEYSGKLKLIEGKLPEIKSGKSDIQLLIPLDTVDNLELADGKDIRVKGFEYRKRFFIFKGSPVLMVNEIESNGNISVIHNNILNYGLRRDFGRNCW